MSAMSPRCSLVRCITGPSGNRQRQRTAKARCAGNVEGISMQIRCLHCHEPVEVPDGSDMFQITCPACAGNFSLAGKETIAYPLKTPETNAPAKARLGHFDLQRPLGKGSFGTVWLAQDL